MKERKLIRVKYNDDNKQQRSEPCPFPSLGDVDPFKSNQL